MPSFEKTRDAEMEAGLPLNPPPSEKGQNHESTSSEPAGRPQMSPRRRFFVILFLSSFVGFTLLRGVALMSVLCTHGHSQLGSHGEMTEDEAISNSMQSVSLEELCKVYPEYCPEEMRTPGDDFEESETEPEDSGMLSKRQDGSNSTGPPATPSGFDETTTTSNPPSSSSVPSSSDTTTSSSREPPSSSAQTTSSQVPSSTITTASSTDIQTSTSAEPTTSSAQQTSSAQTSSVESTSERPSSSSGTSRTSEAPASSSVPVSSRSRPASTSTSSERSTSSPQVSPSETSTPRRSTTSPSSTDSDESTSSRASSSSRRTVTSGTITTSSAERHVFTTTLPDGAPVTSTSTAWVEYVPAAPTGSSDDPELQGSASSWQRSTLLQIAMGVIVGGILMV